MANQDTTALQKGSLEMILLALLEARPRHGYELAKLIESESDNKLQFHVASLYPMLYRLERKAWWKAAGWKKRANAGAASTASPRKGAGHWPSSAAVGGSSRTRSTA
jgi:hypothetical protein